MRKLWLILAATFLVLAACGDDDGGDAAGEVSNEDGATDAGDASETDDGDDGDTDDLGDAAAILSAERCNFFLSGALNPMTGLAPDAAANIDDVGEQLQAIADAAPEEISAEMGLFADRYSVFLELVADAGLDLSDPQSFQDPAMQEVFVEAGEIFDEEFQDAAEAVSAYFEANCSG